MDPIVGLVIGLPDRQNRHMKFIDNIMGKLPSEELITEIRDIANEAAKTNTAHDIKIDYLGSYALVTLHIELDGNIRL